MTGSISPLRAISVRSRPKAFSAGVLISPFFSAPVFQALRRRTASSCAAKLGSSSLQDFLAGLLDIHVEVLQHAGGHAVAFAQQSQQDVLGADIGVIQRLGLLWRRAPGPS